MERLSCKEMLTHISWSNYASSSMYDKQVINYINEFISLDDESVKTLCKFLCHTMGVTENGDLDLGVKVKSRSESKFILAVYFIKHRYRVSIYVTFINEMLETLDISHFF